MAVSNLTKFLILCVVWGLTWIAVKYGVSSVSPMVFAGTRFVTAGLILLGVACFQGKLKRIGGKGAARLAAAGLLMITLCYGPLFWGMQFIPSGTAAVLEMSLTPVSLLVFGIMLGEERWALSLGIGMAIGIIGLCLLFSGQHESQEFGWLGIAAVGWAAASSALGSVIARPLISSHGSMTVAASTTLFGGAVLLLSAYWLGADASEFIPFNWTVAAVGGWLFLVVFGSLIGYSLYIQLVRDIGPARSGSFAFVSPVIAVATGASVAGEAVDLNNLAGMSFLLASAAICLYGQNMRNVISSGLPSATTKPGSRSRTGLNSRMLGRSKDRPVR